MGMNYFFIKETGGARKHIGKSSAGWTFLFHGYDEDDFKISSRSDWEKYLLDNRVVILNDEGMKITIQKFFCVVNDSVGKKIQTITPDDHLSWKDQEGFVFRSEYFC